MELKETMGKQTAPNSNLAINSDEPIRLAFLGGSRTGKTALVSKLTSGTYCDTYYPLRLITPVLFNFEASTNILEAVMDETRCADALRLMLQNDNVWMSPVVYKALQDNNKTNMVVENGNVSTCNDYYASFSHKSDHGRVSGVTPVLAELIDTPGFNANLIVPFIEVSIYMKLDRDVLHKLADTPAQPVSTNPLLVASGASELNGSVDGYFLVYTAIPTKEPPAYEEIDTSSEASASTCESGEAYNDDGTFKSATAHQSNHDGSFSFISVMKNALEDAWKEYYTYKTRWEKGAERDVFLFKSALKNILTDRSATPKRQEFVKLMDTSNDPASPLCPPPIWIVCTNAKSPLASPKLIQNGKLLAQQWKCGFVAVDAENNVDEVLSLMIRELAERRNLRRDRR